MTRELTILLLVGVAVFARTLGGEFLSWDDAQHFAQNVALKNFDLAAFWRQPYYGLYIPVTYSVWTLLYALAPAPWIFHALSLALHLANTALVYAFTRRRSGSAALFVAGLFMLHPVQVEAVAWISGGRDLLMAFFALLGVALLDRGRRGWATFLFALSLLSKPGLAALPLALPFLPRPPRLGKVWTGVWLALAALSLALTRAIQEPFTQARVALLSSGQRALIALDALGFYLGKFVWPFALNADYGRTPPVALAQNLFVPSAAALAALLCTRDRRRWAFAAILLSPVLGFVPFEAQVQSTVFDRYLYLPIFGAAFAVARLRSRALRAGLLALCAVSSFQRAGVWRSNRHLFADIIRKNPRSYFAQVNFANAELAEGRIDSSEAHLKLARDLNPRLALAPANLANVYWIRHDVAGILDLGEALIADPDFLKYNAHEPDALALLYRMVARAENALRRGDLARAAYLEAERLNPNDLDLRTEASLFRAERR